MARSTWWPRSLPARARRPGSADHLRPVTVRSGTLLSLNRPISPVQDLPCLRGATSTRSRGSGARGADHHNRHTRQETTSGHSATSRSASCAAACSDAADRELTHARGNGLNLCCTAPMVPEPLSPKDPMHAVSVDTHSTQDDTVQSMLHAVVTVPAELRQASPRAAALGLDSSLERDWRLGQPGAEELITRVGQEFGVRLDENALTVAKTPRDLLRLVRQVSPASTTDAVLAALNALVSARIDQIRVNLERLRRVGRALVSGQLLVDIAGFETGLWLDGRKAWRSREVVGHLYRRSPEFRSTMEYLVLNPEWAVPLAILSKDVLPRVLRDRGYLARQCMRLIDRVGRRRLGRRAQAPRRLPYRVVQASGPANALGRIRFMAPMDTWCSCTTRRRASCSSAQHAPTARAASASSAHMSWPYCRLTMPNAGGRSGSPRSSMTGARRRCRCAGMYRCCCTKLGSFSVQWPGSVPRWQAQQHPCSGARSACGCWQAAARPQALACDCDARWR